MQAFNADPQPAFKTPSKKVQSAILALIETMSLDEMLAAMENPGPVARAARKIAATGKNVEAPK